MAFGKVIGLDSSTSWDPQVSVIPAYIHHFEHGDPVTVYVSTNSTGTVTATLSSTTYYNVQKINNNEFVINRVGNKVPMTNLGTVTLTITVAADTTQGFRAVTRTVKIENPAAGGGNYATALSATDVGNIQNALNLGIAENIWNVGDSTANITLSGVVGARSFNNYTSTCAYILGFNHNAALETGGKKSIHFCLGRFASTVNSTLKGKDLAFVDSNLYETGSTAAFRMNLTNSNSGGWQYSYMRTVICAQFLSAINASWTTYIKPVIKYTDNVGGATNDYENVTGTEDYIFLMSEFEIFGSRSYANSYEKSFQQRYDYYAINNHASARIRGADSKVSNATSGVVDAGDAVHWWERSPSRVHNMTVSTCVGIVSQTHVIEDNQMDSRDIHSDHNVGFVPNFVMVQA